MTQIAQPPNEPLPGYFAIECIGTGGYGEVWKARAPGGVEKAVKTLHGYHNEELAGRELKALERIKDVRHPFILSLDRFEVHAGRLVVVMELADMSLEQCYQLHRAEQRDGIPRDELISYLRDAAEALDYMQQQHTLQHLDIKPENLLLLGRHIKVADFGLVKEVAGRTLNSMVGGMTPTYAAPEIFDNRPSPHSDQYSLAIVFQEMLTGVLPFPGRTAAQLVAQHTQGKPQVIALPERDRPVVLKALAKDPNQRYPSCSALIDELAGGPLNANHKWVAVSTKGSESLSIDDTQDVSSYQTEPIPSSTDAPERHGTEVMPAESNSQASFGRPSQRAASDKGIDKGTQVRTRHDQPYHPAKPSPGLEQKESLTGSRAPSRNIPQEREIVVSTQVVELPVPKLPSNPHALQPTLVIGLGGVGGNVLRQLQSHLLQRGPDVPWPELIPMLALDTDQDDLRNLRNRSVETSAGPLIDSLLLPLRRPQQYKTRSPHLLQWLSRRWLYNISRSLKTRGYRPLGRLSLVDNMKVVLKTVQSHLNRITDSQHVESIAATHELTCRNKTPRVVLITSTSGGTGSGIAVDLAHAVRKVASTCGAADIEIVGMFVDCSREGNEAGELTTANSYAFLTEYETACQQGNRSQENLPNDMAVFEGESSPYDHVYYSSLEGYESSQSVETWIEHTAEYLAVDLLSSVGSLLDLCRSAHNKEFDNPQATSQFRSFSLAPLNEPSEELLQAAHQRLCLQVIQHWQVAASVTNHQQRQSGDLVNHEQVSQWNLLLEQLDQEIQETFQVREPGNFMDILAELLEVRLLESELHHPFEGKPVLPSCYRNTITSASEQLAYTSQRVGKLLTDDPSEKANENLHDGEMGLHHDSLPDNDELLELAGRVSLEACHGYLRALESAEEQHPDLLATLQQVATETLEQLTASGDSSNLIAQLADDVADIGQVARGLNASPPRCGHGRRTIVAIPQQWPNDSLETKAKQALPGAAIVRACIPRPLVLVEAANLSLAQVAARLTESRPDAIDAAKRLYTRNDIEWTPLPSVVCKDAN